VREQACEKGRIRRLVRRSDPMTLVRLAYLLIQARQA